jgi:hypothetical protein
MGAGVTSLARARSRNAKWLGQAYALAGREPKLMVAGKTMLRVLGLVNPLMRELVEMDYLMTDPVVLDDSALTELIGPIARTSYEDGIRRTFDAARRAASASGTTHRTAESAH